MSPMANLTLTEKHRASFFSRSTEFLIYKSGKGQALPKSRAGLFCCTGCSAQPLHFRIQPALFFIPEKPCSLQKFDLVSGCGFSVSAGLVCDGVILDHFVYVSYEGLIYE